MAHVAPTPLSVRSRGQTHRYHDLRTHPLAYARLCGACHGKLDAGMLGIIGSRRDLGLDTPVWAV